MKLPGTETQAENIHIVMGKLEIKPGMLFLDVGCGSGAVSLAASRFTERIYGIDLRREAVEKSSARVPGGTFLHGQASELIRELPEIDRCFIGGSQKINLFFPELVKKMSPGGVIVANLARIKMAAYTAELMREHGIFDELLQVQISRGYQLGGDTALKPINPIFMVVGRC
jgi:cobalt-precorrin-6B (C15)-methyltransferase